MRAGNGIPVATFRRAACSRRGQPGRKSTMAKPIHLSNVNISLQEFQEIASGK
jgi:hypothetical protein